VDGRSVNLHVLKWLGFGWWLCLQTRFEDWITQTLFVDVEEWRIDFVAFLEINHSLPILDFMLFRDL
jgi:hypothetical protein